MRSVNAALWLFNLTIYFLRRVEHNNSVLGSSLFKKAKRLENRAKAADAEANRAERIRASMEKLISS